MQWYKFTCPICSGVIEGADKPVVIDDGNEDDRRTYDVISEGDRRLCRWDDIPAGLKIQIVLHIYNYSKEHKKQHPELMLAPDVTYHVLDMKLINAINNEGLSHGTESIQMDQCPLISLHILTMSYINTSWRPPPSDFNATAILRVKKHLCVWKGVSYREDRKRRARPPITELQALMESAMEAINEKFYHDSHIRHKICDKEGLKFLESAIHNIIVTVLNSLDSNDASTIFANNFQPDEFVRYMVNILSTAVKAALPCPTEETKDYYQGQVDQFSLMVSSHLKCIAQCDESG
jgi:hypothetical protein